MGNGTSVTRMSIPLGAESRKCGVKFNKVKLSTIERKILNKNIVGNWSLLARGRSSWTQIAYSWARSNFQCYLW